MPEILARLGYRTVLVGNTIVVGLMIMSFATVGADTPVWRIVLQAFVLGFFTSMQYTSMNTLVYADVTGSTDQQRQHHRQHRPADVDQLRRRQRLADRRALRARAPAVRPSA